MSNFLETLVKDDLPLAVIMKTVDKIPLKKLNQHLIYFVECQASDSEHIRQLADMLARKIKPRNLSEHFYRLFDFWLHENHRVRSLARELVQKMNSGELVKHIDILMKCQASWSYEAFGEFTKELLQQIEPKDLAKKLEFFCECQYSEHEHVRELSEELALKISKKDLVKKVDYLVHSGKDKKEVSELSRRLALEAMRGWSVRRLSRYVDYLISCQIFPMYQEAYYPAQALTLQVMQGWSAKKLLKKLPYLLSCQDSQNKNFKDKATALVSKIEPRLLLLSLDYLFRYQEKDGFASRDFSEELVIGVIKDWSPEQLADKLEYLIRCQAASNKSVRTLARTLALRINPDVFYEKLELLLDFVKNGHRTSTAVKDLAAELALEIPAEKLVGKLDIFLDCHGNYTDLLPLLKKLAYKIPPDQLMDKFDYLILRHKQGNMYDKQLVQGLILNLEVDKLVTKFDFFVNYLASESEDSFHYEFARFAALRVMQDWPPEDLAPRLDYLFDCQKTHHFDGIILAKQLTLRVMQTWRTEELSNKVEYLIGCEDIRNQSSVNLARLLALKVMQNWTNPELAKQFDYLKKCCDSGDQLVRKLSGQLINRMEKTARRAVAEVMNLV